MFILTVLCAAFAAGTYALSDLNELEFDENDRLIGNHLFFTQSSTCNIGRDELAMRPSEPISSHLVEAYFGTDPASYGCAAVCIQKGTHRDHVLHPLPMYVGKHLTSIYNFAFENCQKTEVGFLSYNPNVADIMWVNNGKQHKVGTLKTGEKNTVWQTSYLGHQFVVQDSVSKETLLELTVTHNSVYAIGNHKSALQVHLPRLNTNHNPFSIILVLYADLFTYNLNFKTPSLNCYICCFCIYIFLIKTIDSRCGT